MQFGIPSARELHPERCWKCSTSAISRFEGGAQMPVHTICEHGDVKYADVLGFRF